jgi:hypothetical protein
MAATKEAKKTWVQTVTMTGAQGEIKNFTIKIPYGCVLKKIQVTSKFKT